MRRRLLLYRCRSRFMYCTVFVVIFILPESSRVERPFFWPSFGMQQSCRSPQVSRQLPLGSLARIMRRFLTDWLRPRKTNCAIGRLILKYETLIAPKSNGFSRFRFASSTYRPLITLVDFPHSSFWLVSGRGFCPPTNCSLRNEKVPGSRPGLSYLASLVISTYSSSHHNNWNMIYHHRPLISLFAMRRLTHAVGDPAKCFTITSPNLINF